MGKRVGAAVALLGVVGASDAHANEPFEHDGFQFRAAVGAGVATDSESAEDGSFGGRISGFVPLAVEVYLGGAPRPGWTLGGMLSLMPATTGASASFHGQGSSAGSSSVGLGLTGLGPYIDWYPDSHGGFHVSVMGMGVLADAADGHVSTSIGSGFALGAGVGYDGWVHERWSLGVLARLTYAWPVTSTQTNDLTSVDHQMLLPGFFGSIVFQ
jgi:hypothetical protein